MFSKKQLVIISFVLAIVFHFVFYFNSYGPSVSIFQGYPIYLLALVSALLMIFLYFGTYWRSDLKGSSISKIFDLLVLWIFICFFRSLLLMHDASDLMPFLFSNYMALSLFPVLFFIVGVNINYFYSVNKILSVYFVLATVVSLFFINYFEFQLFLLFPIFYIIITIPLRSFWSRLFIILVSVSVIIFSLTNRAGILRILISYAIVIAYYVMFYVKINRKLLNLIVFCILLIPVVSLYVGIHGRSVFQIVSGENAGEYSQLNPYTDTRTFLYYEVFQDLKVNNAFVFGKGLNATYESEAFQTLGRPMVEVGFLQILMKTGIVGVILYLLVIIIAIFKALVKSNSIHMKSLGLLLSGYILMLFIENIIAYNLLNVIIWIVVGMCCSPKLRAMNDKEIKLLITSSSFNAGVIESKSD